MDRILIVSNRLPVNTKISNNSLEINPSVGGLATGLKSVYEQQNSLWIGWPGITSDDFQSFSKEDIAAEMLNRKCIPVFLSQAEVDLYYYGYSNNTIWPLFHYFTQYSEFHKDQWEMYKRVNQKFANELIKHIKPGDKIWVHDYHLLLLPALIRKHKPHIQIGFFLHIPFPSFEVFRNLPWRNEILEGMLGADLIGFHVYDYERHFISSVRRLLGYEIHFNEINLVDRVVKIDAFPMGIDYEKFQNAAISVLHKSIKDKSKFRQELEKHLLVSPEIKLILSLDRLDYTKGIANRLHAFKYFLKKYPNFREKVTLVMLSVPSRSAVEQYRLMKSEVDELVGRINGEYATINWTPIWYFYRALPFENLVDLYTSCDIALLTPIRDGMNLVAKEFIACRIDKKGVLILSEMAGAAKEMGESISVNPHNYEEIAEALQDAILMDEEEQVKRNTILQERLKRYNIEKWSTDFLNALYKTAERRDKYIAKKINQKTGKEIKSAFHAAKKRILFLDYDGSLVGFQNKPEDASPDKDLFLILDKLAAYPNTELILISGRDKESFNQWFSSKKYALITEHGVWSKNPGGAWKLIEPINTDWKEIIRPVIEFYVDRTPGSFVEEKNYSLVWHYRRVDHELGLIRANELKDEMTSFIANHNLEILEGNKIIEIKNSGINKGRAAVMFMAGKKYDFILGVGDDWTDEYLFEELPSEAYTIKVGPANTYAKFQLDSVANVRKFLKSLIKD